MGIDAKSIKIVTFAIEWRNCEDRGRTADHFVLVQTPDALGFWSGVNYLVFAVLGGSYVVWGPLLGALTPAIDIAPGTLALFRSRIGTSCTVPC